ncbi:M61 family metallopeptidase [Algoriphagus sp. H41]|uniref:M61 family metallopeptidase n=1 Tax=Algoriphagus oliviformis TaxID=2811231 RepID=A0ABS3BXS6_9BACT|nr:M61 family metallopeptidase [Algoriphagus oliviformis]MBN7809668.1 M61 family metallopeptidase [Algoriphagus oliviformis]
MNLFAKPNPFALVFSFCLLLAFFPGKLSAQSETASMHYEVGPKDAASHLFAVSLHTEGWDRDTLDFKLPNWTPGYYQLMNYSEKVSGFKVVDAAGKAIPFSKPTANTWRVIAPRGSEIRIEYAVLADRKFVATSFLDETHMYIVPAALFLYVDGAIDQPVSLRVDKGKWRDIATSLEAVAGRADTFEASDFDLFYDSPLLVGDLETLEPFRVGGANHRFIGYGFSDFDRKTFMANLKKVVEESVKIIGDVPFSEYTFIGIGPGRGGIEHLNNTTVSFDGKGLDTPEGMNTTLNFLAHEYFHHYNVKRIRPFELGPFDYDKGTKTNLLWVSEGLTVYYEYLILQRGGLADEEMTLKNLAKNIRATENNPGRLHQSLAQASFATWKDGPFGTDGTEPGKAISYYDKGPVVGLLLDFAIRQATANAKSLDDVMRKLYWEYYKNRNRGFTDAEFQQICEETAGKALTEVFEYVSTTKELDYDKYLEYAGLELVRNTTTNAEGTESVAFELKRKANMTAEQKEILESWLGKKD